MIGLLLMLEYCFDKLEREISACWSILAKNHIISSKKLQFYDRIIFYMDIATDKYILFFVDDERPRLNS